MQKGKVLKRCLPLIVTAGLILSLSLLFCEQSMAEQQVWTIQLRRGWNLISLPVECSPQYTAENMGQEINSQGGGVTFIQA